MKLSRNVICALVLAWLSGAARIPAVEYEATIEPLVHVVDLDRGERVSIPMSNGRSASIELISVDERRDGVRNAVREAVATVNVNGKTVRLVSATYHLPREVAGVQIDCPVTSGYVEGSSNDNVWGLEKTARFRLWPAGSSWIRNDTFRYPARQRWFATQTQMANEPVYVDGGEQPSSERIYYHYGLDIGGAEGLVPVVSATDALVVSATAKCWQAMTRRRRSSLVATSFTCWIAEDGTTATAISILLTTRFRSARKSGWATPSEYWARKERVAVGPISISRSTVANLPGSGELPTGTHFCGRHICSSMRRRSLPSRGRITSWPWEKKSPSMADCRGARPVTSPVTHGCLARNGWPERG